MATETWTPLWPGFERAGDGEEATTGGGGTYTDEQAQDATAAALAAGTHVGVAVAYDDASNAISLTATGTTSPDATTTTKGIVQLAGDLSGTSAAPTVPALAGKANAADLGTAAASDIGDFATAAQGAKADSAVQGDGTILTVVKLTQAAYDALTPVATTLYVISG